MKNKIWPLILLGCGALLMLSKKAYQKLTKKDLYALHGGFEGYVVHLHNIWLQHIPTLLTWTRAKMAQTTKRLASQAGIPSKYLWATVLAESSASPLGIPGSKIDITKQTFSSDPQKAIALNSTAYGPAQMTVSTFDGIQAKYGLRFNHDDLWNPENGILAGAMLLRDLYTKFGNWEKVIAAYRGGTPEQQQYAVAKRIALAEQQGYEVA